MYLGWRCLSWRVGEVFLAGNAPVRLPLDLQHAEKVDQGEIRSHTHRGCAVR